MDRQKWYSLNCLPDGLPRQTENSQGKIRANGLLRCRLGGIPNFRGKKFRRHSVTCTSHCCDQLPNNHVSSISLHIHHDLQQVEYQIFRNFPSPRVLNLHFQAITPTLADEMREKRNLQLWLYKHLVDTETQTTSVRKISSTLSSQGLKIICKTFAGLMLSSPLLLFLSSTSFLTETAVPVQHVVCFHETPGSLVCSLYPVGRKSRWA